VRNRSSWVRNCSGPRLADDAAQQAHCSSTYTFTSAVPTVLSSFYNAISYSEKRKRRCGYSSRIDRAVARHHDRHGQLARLAPPSAADTVISASRCRATRGLTTGVRGSGAPRPRSAPAGLGDLRRAGLGETRVSDFVVGDQDGSSSGPPVDAQLGYGSPRLAVDGHAAARRLAAWMPLCLRRF
jgi:hypothetical protein